jgi:hypothetical protein
LDYSAADELATADANVDDALKSEGEAICGVFIKRLWDEGRDRFGRMVVGRQKAVKKSRVLGRRWRETKVVKHAYETFEAAIHDHNLSYSGRSGGEIGEVGKGIEEWKG